MNDIWVIVYTVSERGGHGEGSTNHRALSDAGYFESESAAQAFIDRTRQAWGEGRRFPFKVRPN